MAIHVAPELVEPFARGLVGATDVDGGPTEEQLAVLRAISTEVWGRDDLDPDAIGGLGPDELARAIAEPDARRRFQEMLVAVEMCRHPLSANQVDRVEEYSRALAVPMEELTILRDLVDVGAKRAAADFQRCFEARIEARSEPSMRDVPIQDDAPEPELVARIEALGDLPEGTLSRPGAITLMAEDLARGARCTASFAFVDHFEIADRPLAEVRERFGVGAPKRPDDGHHHWTT